MQNDRKNGGAFDMRKWCMKMDETKRIMAAKVDLWDDAAEGLQ